MPASRWARSAVIIPPFVENLTPIPRPTQYSTSSKKSGRTVGSPPPTLM
jgi:hypothetical protein